MGELIRFGVSIESHLLDQFDRLLEQKNYSNRSEAIRDLIRNELVRQEWQDDEAEAVGTVTIIYDHHVRELSGVLTAVQHDFHKQIISTLHVHLDHHNCLEVLAVKGKTKIIRQIANSLISIKGVKHGKLVMTTRGEKV
ncbi:MAG: nickel-responsive transcriptional regulator NikR [candidate division KSB1 bacterium]|nr:nickel-responsive transcriptional regulator NikR [candidate division KSB1 bacterium]MDZ7318663.1 nickel-responsive transcriptional regulator NikR [candidate division KSB1 bacterium]MDZ7342059.1 nickel-responsive transcriptional regulator NikR [candidate division KSB1 bacterium]